MRKKIVHALGAITWEEHESLIKNLLTLVSELKEDKRFYRSRVFGNQASVDTKQDLIGQAKLDSQQPPDMQPIGRARTPWTILRKRFEAQDRERSANVASAHKQIDRLEEYWRDKNAGVSSGEEIS